MNIREGNIQDLNQIQHLAQKEWSRYKSVLTPENWKKLYANLSDSQTFTDLLEQSDCFVCDNEKHEIIGFGFLVPSGNPTDIYNEKQSYIRFITANSEYKGQKIGQKITEKCINKAKENGEKYVALHTSEIMDAARHIYEKLNFRIVKELEPRLGKRYWLYELAL